MNKVLVTGGFGFIGSYLVEALVSDPQNQVHVVDNLSTSPIDLPPFLERLGKPKNLTYEICSVDRFCTELSAVKSFQQIYHLASVVGPVGVLAHAGNIAFQIVRDAKLLAELALRNGARVVDVSTSEVYGGGRDGYCSEKDSKVIQPQVTVRLEYAMGKLAAEIALINTARARSLNVSIVRPFNVAGPRQSAAGGFVLPRFINQARARAPLTVYNGGQMIRAFTHVSDIVDGILLVMAKGRCGDVYNIGNPANKISIMELADRVISVTNSQSTVSHVDPKALFGDLFAEANDKYPDADRAKNELGWNPKYTIDEIILDTYNYANSGRND